MNKIKEMINVLKLIVNRTKKMLKTIFFQTFIIVTLATITHQIGIKIENRMINIGNIIVIAVIVLIIITIIMKKIKTRDNGCLNCSYSKSCNKIKCE